MDWYRTTAYSQAVLRVPAGAYLPSLGDELAEAESELLVGDISNALFVFTCEDTGAAGGCSPAPNIADGEPSRGEEEANITRNKLARVNAVKNFPIFVCAQQ